MQIHCMDSEILRTHNPRVGGEHYRRSFGTILPMFSAPIFRIISNISQPRLHLHRGRRWRRRSIIVSLVAALVEAAVRVFVSADAAQQRTTHGFQPWKEHVADQSSATCSKEGSDAATLLTSNVLASVRNRGLGLCCGCGCDFGYGLGVRSLGRSSGCWHCL